VMPTPTATPTRLVSCVRWDNAWRDEFDEPRLAQWWADWGQGSGSVVDSVLVLRGGNATTTFPLLWTQPSFPDGDWVLSLAFRYGPSTYYGTTIGVGTDSNGGRRYEEGVHAEGIEDVLSIYQSADSFRISLWDQVTWFGLVPDTQWHVAQVARSGATYALNVDGRRIGVAMREGSSPASLYIGNPYTMTYPGRWTPIEVDWIRVQACGLWGDCQTWLPLVIRAGR